MVGVVHGNDPRALPAEDPGQRFVNLRKLLVKLVQQVFVMFGQARARSGERRRGFDGSRNVENQPLPTELPIGHRLPIAREALVACAASPDVHSALGLVVVAQQLALVVGIAEPLDLQPLVVAQ